MTTAVKNSSEHDVQALLRLLISGKLNTTEYTQRLAKLQSPNASSSSTRSVAPNAHTERILGLRGAVHHNPFHPGEHWSLQNQRTLRKINPRLAAQLQAQALKRVDSNHVSTALPAFLPNPWIFGPHYSVAQQTQIQNASPTLALQLQMECVRMGQDL
jgi:hypothetical protein